MKWIRLFRVVLVAAMLVSGPVLADGPLDQIVGQLRAQGYQVTNVSRTWLGRIKAEAEGGGYQREVVFNRVTGEVLRDYRVQKAAPQPGGNTSSGNTSNSGASRGTKKQKNDDGDGGSSGSSGSNSGSGSSGNSGSGSSGNSGSGSSGSNSGSGSSGGGDDNSGHGGGDDDSGDDGDDD